MAKILVVDDDVEISTILSEFAAALGHEVFTSNEPSEVFALIRRERPDLMLCDYQMPGMTGTQVLAELRLDPAMRRLPVVFVSGTDAITFSGEVPPEPWVRFLRKPPDFAQLETTIAELLNPDGWSAQTDPLPER